MHWPDLDQNNIATLVVFGVIIPDGVNRKFERRSVSSIGSSSGSVVEVIVSVEVQRVELIYRFRRVA
jgi:hypothetical protein